ncbi:hypothetical protein P691DRAFT_766951 [Macrolepiota fuliginosa MF-IS2]|uniref:Uncharacterized protein n=1 Tax=Macrolepiota fuliginosa MF-IS2 TaxID=1400762 RepID=A0A9P6BVN8_9AGAR|nr:hypothetical protein P691DRAFT_766951 [Macrolepiota fuliginosa MF-IS2]
MLGILVVFTQLLGFSGTFWIKTQGEAYRYPGEGSTSQYAFRSFSAIDLKIPIDGGLVVLVTALLLITTLMDGAQWAGLCMALQRPSAGHVSFGQLNLNLLTRHWISGPTSRTTTNTKPNHSPVCRSSSGGSDPHIVIDNLTAKYSLESPAVLRDVSFQIEGCAAGWVVRADGTQQAHVRHEYSAPYRPYLIGAQVMKG